MRVEPARPDAKRGLGTGGRHRTFLEHHARSLLEKKHLHVLRTVREVRNALRYVSSNARRHLAKLGRALPRAARVDPASSGARFLGWQPGVRLPEAIGPPPVARATTWLARVGWRRLGLLEPAEI